MTRPLAFAFCVALALAVNSACSFKQTPKTATTTNNSTPAEAKQAPAKTEAAPSAPAGELQPGQASGSFTAKGETVELKYAYAGKAERFGTESLVILLTDKPIPSEALAEEIKSAKLLEDEKLRGLEYVIDENSMWVRYHPSQYQESSSNKLKDYKVEAGIVRGFDDNDGDLSNGKYARSVKFVAAIAK